jgi:hypothetical protein
MTRISTLPADTIGRRRPAAWPPGARVERPGAGRASSARTRPGRGRAGRWLAGLAAIAAFGLVAPAPALGGSYVVEACGSNGVNGSWWASASPGLVAYSKCPGADYDGVGTGLVSRSTQNGNGGSVPVGSGAWEEFDAPPGAGLASIRFNASSGRPDACWALGLYGWSDGDPNAAWHAWGYDADCPNTGGGWSYYAGPYHLDLGGVGHVRMGIRCDNWHGCSTGSSIPAWANLNDVAVTVVDGTQPGISPTMGELWSDRWLRGAGAAWASLTDNVGIRKMFGSVDGGQPFSYQDFADGGWPDAIRCDYARARPCSDNGSAGVWLDTASVADGEHTLRVTAVDAAGNEGHVDRAIRVDNHAPSEPRGAEVAGGDGWRRTNDFAVTWHDPPGQAAPIVRARWRLCRGGDCTTGERAGRGIERLDGLRAPGTGDHTLSVWLEDEAGNADEQSGSAAVHLRLDQAPPGSPGFDPPDPADPRRLALAVSDEGAGVAGASIQLRPRAGGEWRTLPTELAGDRAWTQVPDLELRDGAYDVRALLRDGAGNETVVTGDLAGRPTSIVLPVRRVTRLGAPAGLRLAFGRAGRLTGTLTTDRDRPVGPATLSVLARLASQFHFRAVGTVQVDGGGRFAYRVPPGPARTVRLGFGGDALLLPASADTRVAVPAGVTLRASRRQVRNGGAVVFTGRLAGGPYPRGGRTVDLQAHYRGAWRTFATPRADSHGRFRQAYRFGATVGRVVYRFRVLAKRDAAYPYEQGASPTVRVTVTG